MKTIRSVKYIIFALLSLCVFAVFGTVSYAYAENEADDKVIVTIVAEGKHFVYTDERIAPSDFTVAEEIETRMINAPLAQKLEHVDMCLAKGADYKTALSVCFPLMPKTVDAVAEYLRVDAVEAEVKYNGKDFYVTPEKVGRRLDENKLYAGIYCCIKFSGGGTVNASTVKLEPSVTRQELESNLKLRSKYTTDYSTSTSSRAHNVALALSKIDGMSVAPDETLSFNKVVGERTEANGFESAKIIVDGKYTDGVGGGVCQASTALYNAALLSDLFCTANAHSICPSYCPAGLDAMISSVSDLTVKNTTAHPVYISVGFSGRKATVRIFGEPLDYTVVPESVTIKKVAFDEIEKVDEERKYFEETAVSGDRLLVSIGKEGIVSETYLKYYKNGKFFKRVKIRSNEYRSVPQVIAVAP